MYYFCFSFTTYRGKGEKLYIHITVFSFHKIIGLIGGLEKMSISLSRGTDNPIL